MRYLSSLQSGVTLINSRVFVTNTDGADWVVSASEVGKLSWTWNALNKSDKLHGGLEEEKDSELWYPWMF